MPLPVISRDDLKSRFNHGDIPTEQDFIFLINSAINTNDDNLKKESNSPLQIGNTDSLHKMIEFFRGAASGSAAWSVGLSAGANQPGFAINDSGGNRLLLKDGSGEIEIGRASLPTAVKFVNNIGNKIQLWTNPNNNICFYGFELIGSTLRIQTDASTADVVMGYKTGQGDNFTETMRVRGSGFVGIGSNNPLYPLHVYKNVAGDWVAKFENANPGGGANVWLAHGSGNGAAIHAGANASAGTYALDVVSNNVSRFFVRGDGNVGVGTTAPSSKLVIDSGGDFNDSVFGRFRGLVELVKEGTQTLGSHTAKIIVSKFHHRVEVKGGVVSNLSDFTELFESEGKKQIPIGTAVILNKQGLIRAAKKTEIPMGVISVAPAIVCNNADEWPQKHLKNEFGQLLTEEVEEDITTPDGKTERAIVRKPILNPDYDPNREYIPRDQRPEWHPVGLLGQLHLRTGQPVAPTWVKIKDVSENVELWLVK